MTERLRQTDYLASRRRVLKWLIRLGYGAFAVVLALPALALKSLTQEEKVIARGDSLVYALGDRAGTPVNADELQVGQAVQAFPEGKSDDQNNLIELVRIGEGAGGLVAYSAICTHLGCTVLPQLTDAGYVPCPCHASLFDPANGARPVGGPANRPLPSLPITVESDGAVVAAGTFDGPIGPE
jgi:rieske iron-sulfur protein